MAIDEGLLYFGLKTAENNDRQNHKTCSRDDRNVFEMTLKVKKNT